MQLLCLQNVFERTSFLVRYRPFYTVRRGGSKALSRTRGHPPYPAHLRRSSNVWKFDNSNNMASGAMQDAQWLRQGNLAATDVEACSSDALGPGQAVPFRSSFMPACVNPHAPVRSLGMIVGRFHLFLILDGLPGS